MHKFRPDAEVDAVINSTATPGHAIASVVKEQVNQADFAALKNFMHRQNYGCPGCSDNPVV